MRKKSLFKTNRYLKNFKNYQDALITNVSSSTAIETGASVQAITETLAAARSRIFLRYPTEAKKELLISSENNCSIDL
ncbi:MAG: hypothetical protein PHP23_09340 [Desulfobacterales bacterium]|nr:hypothetical protein [Desulfobacterales bacterium]MDD4073399.1 hypothetical protein [Desulfobacterales bacterium]MDD4392007.1 hypothetical protein [Desulfobacterales bacterium]